MTELQKITAEYVAKVRELSGKNDSTFRLFVNSNMHGTSWETKEPAQLKHEGISMRNLRCQWIEE